MNTRHRRGLTLIDMMLTIVVLAIVVAVAAPGLRPNDSLKLISAATILTADLEFAQSATLENPADPTVLRVDEDAQRYWLALASDPDKPILRTSGTPYEVFFGAAGAAHLEGLTISAKDLPAGTVTYDGFGRLTASEDLVLTLVAPTGELAVRIASATGSVYIGQ